MAESIFVCGIDQEAGSSVVSLGLFDALRRVVDKLAFMKPVGEGPNDQDVALLRSSQRLSHDPADLCPLSIAEARQLVSREKHQDLLDRIAQSYNDLRTANRFVILGGINNQRAVSAFDMEINQRIAAHLESPVLLVVRDTRDDHHTSVQPVVDAALTAKREFEESGADVIGVVVNRVRDPQIERATLEFCEAFGKVGLTMYGAIPNLAFLGYPKLEQIAEGLGAEVISGGEALNVVATKILVAAMEPRNFLSYLDTDKTLVITPGDREDILVALACAQKSPDRRSISGIVLTGGLRPDPEIMKLIDDLELPDLPILSVKADTFQSASLIRDLDVRIRPQDPDKIHTACSAVARHVDHEKLWEALEMPRPKKAKTGSSAFLEQIIEQARASGKRIVLPEGDEPRTLRAVGKIMDMKMCPVALVGDEDKILKAAAEAGVKFNDLVEIVDPTRSRHMDEYVETVVELRKGKRGGMTPEVARQWLLESTIHFGTLMVQCDHTHGLVSGAVHSTGDTIRPALQIIRVRPDVGVASSVFFMALPDRVLVYGDCAIVPNPNTQELASIAIAAARTARAFGIEPCVAMLSYSTGKSGAGESVDKVTEATKLVKERNPDFAIDGPLQYDAAIDPEVGKLKQPDSPVAGRANVFVFPDLDAGNIAYKAVQRSAGALAVGPVLQGLNKPVNDLSRGCKIDDIVYTVAVTAIQAVAI